MLEALSEVPASAALSFASTFLESRASLQEVPSQSFLRDAAAPSKAASRVCFEDEEGLAEQRAAHRDTMAALENAVDSPVMASPSQTSLTALWKDLSPKVRPALLAPEPRLASADSRSSLEKPRFAEEDAICASSSPPPSAAAVSVSVPVSPPAAPSCDACLFCSDFCLLEECRRCAQKRSLVGGELRLLCCECCLCRTRSRAGCTGLPCSRVQTDGAKSDCAGCPYRAPAQLLLLKAKAAQAANSSSSASFEQERFGSETKTCGEEETLLQGRSISARRGGCEDCCAFAVCENAESAKRPLCENSAEQSNGLCRRQSREEEKTEVFVKGGQFPEDSAALRDPHSACQVRACAQPQRDEGVSSSGKTSSLIQQRRLQLAAAAPGATDLPAAHRFMASCGFEGCVAKGETFFRDGVVACSKEEFPEQKAPFREAAAADPSTSVAGLEASAAASDACRHVLGCCLVSCRANCTLHPPPLRSCVGDDGPCAVNFKSRNGCQERRRCDVREDPTAVSSSSASGSGMNAFIQWAANALRRLASGGGGDSLGDGDGSSHSRAREREVKASAEFGAAAPSLEVCAFCAECCSPQQIRVERSQEQQGFPRVSVGGEAEFTRCQVLRQLQLGRVLIAAEGRLFCVNGVLGEHPGGDACLLKKAGQDCTRDFKLHSRCARCAWKRLCCGRLRECRGWTAQREALLNSWRTALAACVAQEDYRRLQPPQKRLQALRQRGVELVAARIAELRSGPSCGDQQPPQV